MPTAQAQSAATESGDVVPVPISQLEQIEKELEYLQAQDAERQAWEASVVSRLPIDRITPVSTEIMSYDGIDAGLQSSAPPDQSAASRHLSVLCGRSKWLLLLQCFDTRQHHVVDCPRATTRDPWVSAQVFGAAKLDVIYNTARPQAPGVPFFLVPEFAGGFPQNTIDINARQSQLGVAFTGPMIGNFQSGGRISAVFFDNTILADRNGFLLQQSYGELFNDDWRFAAGLQLDVFAPGLPTVLPFSGLGGSGSAGNSIKGQIRVERFVPVGSDSQLTLQGALSEPLNTFDIPDISLDEDNGWPNVEGRIAFGLGKPAPSASAC